MRNGMVEQRQRGTPPDGALSLLLSNIVLDELDKELEHRGYKFCRYVTSITWFKVLGLYSLRENNSTVCVHACAAV